MNWFEKWILTGVLRYVVRQGDHKHKLTKFYRDIADVFRNEFTEDNKVTQDVFMTECLMNSLDVDFTKHLEVMSYCNDHGELEPNW